MRADTVICAPQIARRLLDWHALLNWPPLDLSGAVTVEQSDLAPIFDIGNVIALLQQQQEATGDVDENRRNNLAIRRCTHFSAPRLLAIDPAHALDPSAQLDEREPRVKALFWSRKQRNV